MKIEKRKLTYFINGTKFIDLDCLGYAVQQKLFNSSSYQYLLKSHKKKGDKANLISLKVFQEILRKHPKKQPCWCLSGLNFIDCHFNKEKKVKVNDLAKHFSISEVMIRKDLQRLETEGKLKRTHGGAILRKEIVHLSTLDERLINKTIQKSHIAKKIFASISENETIFLDVSSINYMVAELLAEEDKNLVLITNMPSISALFRKDSGTEIIITGGNYNKEIGGIVGSEAIN